MTVNHGNRSHGVICHLVLKVSNNSIVNQLDRARSLISELTLDEKIQLMGNEASGIERLHIPDYQWWSEALHGVGKSPGIIFDSKTPLSFSELLTTRYATSFPQVSLTAQSFDRQLFHRIASTISTEARAMSNVGNAHLTFWSPNVNIFRGTIIAID